MVNKVSLLCILVAFVMCSLAQDTTTLDTTALDTTTQDTPTQDTPTQDTPTQDTTTPTTTTTSGDMVVLNTGLDENGNFDPLTSVDQENHVWDDSPEVNGVVINASTPFPQSLINYMASREMRYHHFMWHQIREGWLNFSAEVQANYASLGWTPPHPARNFTNGTVTSIPDNGSGQDFLYMHRDMLNRAKAVLAENNETYIITGWETLPAPGDLDWPVPENYSIPNDLITQNSTDQWKLDSSYQFLQQAEKNYKDPDYLRNMTLDELGAQIEVTLHVWLHMRWSQNCSVGYRRSYINKNNMTYMDKKWDDPANDWLIDTYSSHVNPAFYKLHGWIDDRVEDWRMAHNLTEIIWNGTWTGGPWSTVSGILMSKQSHLLRGSAPENQNPGMTGMAGMDHSGSGNMDILDAVFKVFVDSGVPEITFADTVLVAPPPPRS